MKNADQFYVKIDGVWYYRSPILLLINPILRGIQLLSNRPFVVVANTGFVGDIPQFKGYSIRRMVPMDEEGSTKYPVK